MKNEEIEQVEFGQKELKGYYNMQYAENYKLIKEFKLTGTDIMLYKYLENEFKMTNNFEGLKAKRMTKDGWMKLSIAEIMESHPFSDSTMRRSIKTLCDVSLIKKKTIGNHTQLFKVFSIDSLGHDAPLLVHQPSHNDQVKQVNLVIMNNQPSHYDQVTYSECIGSQPSNSDVPMDCESVITIKNIKEPNKTTLELKVADAPFSDAFVCGLDDLTFTASNGKQRNYQALVRYTLKEFYKERENYYKGKGFIRKDADAISINEYFKHLHECQPSDLKELLNSYDVYVAKVLYVFFHTAQHPYPATLATYANVKHNNSTLEVNKALGNLAAGRFNVEVDAQEIEELFGTKPRPQQNIKSLIPLTDEDDMSKIGLDEEKVEVIKVTYPKKLIHPEGWVDIAAIGVGDECEETEVVEVEEPNNDYGSYDLD